MKTLLALLAAFLCSPIFAQVAPLIPPVQQFMDANGKPLAGGCLYSYDPASTNPHATYADSTGTVENTNPVLLDSAGRASIWLGNSAYRLSLYSSGGINCASGSPVWTEDNVISSNFFNYPNQAATFSQLTLGGTLSVGGSSSLQNVTMNRACSVNGPLDVVACYGADPTGTLDSTAALNTAFSNSSNQTRYLPAGSYRISNTLHIDTRYKVEGAAPQTSIFANPSFTGTMANVVSSYPQASVVLGGMEGIFWDCRGTATIGVLYGGPNHTVSTFGYQTSNSTMHNCVTAGVQITDEAWELSFYNVGMENNPGAGLQILDGFNMGENINCHSCDISNNGIGVVMGPSSQQGHDFFCYGCSFDFNTNWAIQNQTATTGESMVSLFGGHVESSGNGQRWFQNFNRMYVSGVMFIEGTGTPAYLIDNENYLLWEGGREASAGALAIFKTDQGGLTTCLAVIALGTQNCTNFLDAGPTLNNPGGLNIGGFIAPNRFQQPAASTYAGKCAMSTGTTCTFTIAAGFTNYLSYVTLDNVSTPPATAIQAKCALSGTTATITAGASNSLTWDCFFVGNPN